MDEKARLRQFYLRCLLLAGILWSGMPFLTAPLVNRGIAHPPLAVMASIFGCASLLLASVLGFWHRRVACVWLSLSALALLAAMAASARSGSPFRSYETIGVAGSIVIALCLDWMEFARWPGALDKQTSKSYQ